MAPKKQRNNKRSAIDVLDESIADEELDLSHIDETLKDTRAEGLCSFFPLVY
jgi:hypothetical protein